MALQALNTQFYNPVFSNPDFQQLSVCITQDYMKEYMRNSLYSSPKGSFYILKIVQYLFFIPQHTIERKVSS